MKKLLLSVLGIVSGLTMTAQNIDFNMSNRQDAEVNEPGYVSWVIDQVQSQTKTLDNGLEVTVAATGNSTTLRAQWDKNTCMVGKNGQTGLRLMGDGAMAFILDDDNNTPNQTTIPMSITVTIKGLTIGHHSVAAYHVYKDAKKGLMPTIKVDAVRTDTKEETTVVDGEEVISRTTEDVTVASLSGVEYVNVKEKNHEAELKMADASFSYIEFDITQDGQPIAITYTTEVESGKEYQTSCIILNGLLIDRSPVLAMDPTPNNQDYHYDADDGSCTLQWNAATVAVSHKLVIGTDADEVESSTDYDYEGSETSYTVSGLKKMTTYYWRVDEVDAEGKVFKGNVWSFRPRQLAFPEAEGYGRFAQGGRGGIVYHVTNLSGDKNMPGSLLYGLVNIDEPRYIVFDVSGIIELDFNSYFVKPYAYIAGQTAPGKGVCIKASNINVGSDVIARHIRFKRGLGVYGENTGNAMGMSGANHAIVDHCTAAWGTDETVSGRGAKNISFQYSGIFEALGITGHKNYADGTNHGYAATIDGQMGSWHHNLLLNCEGRNWSMGGGMDANNIPIGGLDLFNNVVYNWRDRTTDGNCHMVNFVNNYYKMGADTRHKVLFTQDFEGAINPAGTNQAYISGNIRENKDHTLTNDKKGTTYEARASKGGSIPTDYDYVVSEPLFPSYATIHSAKDAMKIVTSYAGATMPQRDEQHVRVVKETLSGTYTYVGSKSKIKGEIDNEADITEHAEGKGWETYPEKRREEGFDTDQDGMPDWWEAAIGSNPAAANQNDDPDGDGWTLLEDYLEFMAHPYMMIKAGEQQTIDVKPFFAGFYGQNANYDQMTPAYTVATESNLFTPSVDGSTVKAVANQNSGIGYINVTVDDGETTFTQRIGVAVTGGSTGIVTLKNDNALNSTQPVFDLQGRRLQSISRKGIYIQNGKKFVR
ncbi:MAG: fibronectin type III domain-containing protein [Prevotella sp.]|nr:fibronectin type III domain-containing protein [Prevotella sp.]